MAEEPTEWEQEEQRQKENVAAGYEEDGCCEQQPEESESHGCFQWGEGRERLPERHYVLASPAPVQTRVRLSVSPFRRGIAPASCGVSMILCSGGGL